MLHLRESFLSYRVRQARLLANRFDGNRRNQRRINSAAQADEGAAKTRAALAATPDSAWNDGWKLSFQGKTIFSGKKFLAYRQMFLNHLVHHRAQLGVYYRLLDVPVPGVYGPSADD